MGRGRHHGHALSGEWADYRDCHVKPDLVLVFTDSDDASDEVHLVPAVGLITAASL